MGGQVEDDQGELGGVWGGLGDHVDLLNVSVGFLGGQVCCLGGALWVDQGVVALWVQVLLQTPVE